MQQWRRRRRRHCRPWIVPIIIDVLLLVTTVGLVDRWLIQPEVVMTEGTPRVRK